MARRRHHKGGRKKHVSLTVLRRLRDGAAKGLAKLDARIRAGG